MPTLPKGSPFISFKSLPCITVIVFPRPALLPFPQFKACRVLPLLTELKATLFIYLPVITLSNLMPTQLPTFLIKRGFFSYPYFDTRRMLFKEWVTECMTHETSKERVMTARNTAQESCHGHRSGVEAGTLRMTPEHVSETMADTWSQAEGGISLLLEERGSLVRLGKGKIKSNERK